jgi:ketose-bisphosphate aldolase
MLIPFNQLLSDAQAGGYAVGYFEAWDLYSLEAVLEAAEAENAPVILGFGGVMMEPRWFDSGGLERLGALGLATARAARVPVSLILNEVTTFAQVVRGIQTGFNAVMLDTSDLPYHENVGLTQRIVEMAHAVGVGVEAEVGMLPDASGEMGGGAGRLTDPDEAARFVSETGVDALAVSVGNVHTLTDGQADIDLERLAAIHQAVSLPLVIHGGTGFPEEAISQVIPLGVAKFNFGVVLKQAFLAGLTEAMSFSRASCA